MSSGIAILGLASGALMLSSAALLWSANTTPNSLAKKPFRATNAAAIASIAAMQRTPQRGNLAETLPDPGIYKSFPSLAIVIVPDAGIDPKIIRNPIDCDPRMQKVDPELNFVPQRTKPGTGKP